MLQFINMYEYRLNVLTKSFAQVLRHKNCSIFFVKIVRLYLYDNFLLGEDSNAAIEWCTE